MEDLHNVQLYTRGQVWCQHIDPETAKYEIDRKSPILTKSRPVLIVSPNFINRSEKLLRVVPLTHGGDKSIPTNIEITCPDGDVGLIECIQARPCACIDIIPGSYKFTVSDEIMAKVEKGLMKVDGMEKYLLS